jgi:ATP-dependent RNA helicase DBP3
VPIKVERAKATRQADIDSGVAGALREVANKKKRKQLLKKAKKLAAASSAFGSDEEEEEDEEDQEEQEDDEEEEAEDEDAEDEEEEEAEAEAAAAAEEHHAAEQAEDALGDSVEDAMYAWREKHGVRLVSLDESVVTSEELDADANLGPVTSFEALEEEFGLEPRLVSAATGNFANPTPIQASTWPILLGGKDVIGVAHTGSGKSVRRLHLFSAVQHAWRLPRFSGSLTAHDSCIICPSFCCLSGCIPSACLLFHHAAARARGASNGPSSCSG